MPSPKPARLASLEGPRWPWIAFLALLFLPLPFLTLGNDGEVRRLPTSDRVVALTFDDGPNPAYTPEVLAILRRERVPGTFFLIGSKVTADGGKTDYRGELVGYHTYDHGKMPLMSVAQQEADFRRGAATFPKSYATGPGFWRPPRGQIAPATVRWVDGRGTCLLWSLCYDAVIRTPLDSQGVRGFLPRPERVRALLSRVRPGDIILMHDGNSDGRYLVEDLPDIIHGLRAMGYRLVSPGGYFPRRRG